MKTPKRNSIETDVEQQPQVKRKKRQDNHSVQRNTPDRRLKKKIEDSENDSLKRSRLFQNKDNVKNKSNKKVKQTTQRIDVNDEYYQNTQNSITRAKHQLDFPVDDSSFISKNSKATSSIKPFSKKKTSRVILHNQKSHSEKNKYHENICSTSSFTNDSVMNSRLLQANIEHSENSHSLKHEKVLISTKYTRKQIMILLNLLFLPFLLVLCNSWNIFSFKYFSQNFKNTEKNICQTNFCIFLPNTKKICGDDLYKFEHDIRSQVGLKIKLISKDMISQVAQLSLETDRYGILLNDIEQKINLNHTMKSSNVGNFSQHKTAGLLIRMENLQNNIENKLEILKNISTLNKKSQSNIKKYVNHTMFQDLVQRAIDNHQTNTDAGFDITHYLKKLRIDYQLSSPTYSDICNLKRSQANTFFLRFYNWFCLKLNHVPNAEIVFHPIYPIRSCWSVFSKNITLIVYFRDKPMKIHGLGIEQHLLHYKPLHSIETMPRKLRLIGLNLKEGKISAETHIVDLFYDIAKQPLQTVTNLNNNGSFQGFKIMILQNYGAPYTCLHRVRVYY